MSKALVKIKLTYPNGKPVANIKLNTPVDYDENEIVLDENGEANVYLRGSPDPILFKIDYIDMTWSSEIICLSGSITRVNDAISVTSTVRINATQDIVFSPNVSSITYTLGGAGNGGDSGYQEHAGSGGRGGDVLLDQEANPTPYTKYSVTIGAGGDGGFTDSGSSNSVGSSTTSSKPGKSGGSSSFMGNSVSGGSGGTGGGGAGKYESSTAGHVNNKSSIYGGGGGGGGFREYYFNQAAPNGAGNIYYDPKNASSGAGGGGFGGSYGSVIYGSNLNATHPYADRGDAGSNGGGGGGGGAASARYSQFSSLYYAHGSGGKGSNGFLILQMNLLSESDTI